MKTANRASRNAGKKVQSAQSVTAPKTSPGQTRKPLTRAQMVKWLPLLKQTAKIIRATYIDDPETEALESECLAAIERLQERMLRALDSKKGGAR